MRIKSRFTRIGHVATAANTAASFARRRALWVVKNLSKRGSVKQCRVTLYQYIDAGGILPVWLINHKLPQALSAVKETLNEFKEDEKIDDAERAALSEHFSKTWPTEVYSKEEQDTLDTVRSKFDALGKGNYVLQESPDVFVKMETIYEEGDTPICAKATLILDANIADGMAFELAKMSRGRVSAHLAFGGLERSVSELNNHSQLFHYVIDVKIPGLRPREWLNKMIW